MTKGEAKERLILIDKVFTTLETEDRTALDMAIQALQAQDKAYISYDRGYDRGYVDGVFDYDVCHKCKHFEYDELFIDETGEERDTSYCGRQAQADEDLISRQAVLDTIYTNINKGGYLGALISDIMRLPTAIPLADKIDEIKRIIQSAYCNPQNDYDRGRNYGLHMAIQIILDVCKGRIKDVAIPSAEPNTGHLKDFVMWVANEIFDTWEYNKDAFAEIACRKLNKLGIVKANGDKWELVEPQESEGLDADSN